MNEAVSAAAPGSAAAHQFERLVHIAGLAKTFFSTDQHFTALDGVDLDLAPDDFFCLLGPSGCGKTTVLNILAGFEEPTDGTVEFEGERVAGPSRDRGVVFQADNSLYEWLTARQNVEFGQRLGGASAAERTRVSNEFLSLVGLADQGHKYPHELSGRDAPAGAARAGAREPPADARHGRALRRPRCPEPPRAPGRGFAASGRSTR